jgi:hypothetical protein
VRLAEEMLDTPESMVNPQATVEAALHSLRDRALGDRLDAMERVIGLAQGAEKDRLMDEKNRLKKEMLGMGGKRRWSSLRRR